MNGIEYEVFHDHGATRVCGRLVLSESALVFCTKNTPRHEAGVEEMKTLIARNIEKKLASLAKESQ